MISRVAATVALISTIQLGGDLQAQVADATATSTGAPAFSVSTLALPAPDSAAAAAGLTTVESALMSSRAGDHTAAAELYLSVSEHIPSLADWVVIFATEELAELGDTAGVTELLAGLSADSQIRTRWGWLSIARALEVAGAPAEAASIAAQATLNTRTGPAASLTWLRSGELSLLAGDTSVARNAFTRSMESGNADRFSVSAADALGRLPGLTPNEQYRIARTRVGQNEMRSAIDGLQLMPEVQGLTAEQRAQDRLDLSRAYFTTKRYSDAETNAAEIMEDPAVGPAVRARAQYWVGRSLYRQGNSVRGRATLEGVAEQFPGQRAAGDALYILADLDQDAGRTAAARGYYQQILDVVPASSRADVAGMRLGSLAYLDGDFDEAVAVFDRRRQEAGSSAGRQQAAYWTGLTYESLGQPNSALQSFLEAYAEDPLTYYGARSATRTGGPLLAAGLSPGPSNGPAMDEGELTNAVLRLRVHMRVPTPGSFGFELERLKNHFEGRPAGSYALAEALIEGGLPIQGIVLGREIQRRTDGWNLRLLRVVYPFPHRELIVREAERSNVNPYLAAGIIRQESMFDEEIKSRAGAIGLMQVMPSTGRELAQALGIRPFNAARLTEADVNVRMGMTYLSDMLRRYDGQILDALVAYNAGPTRIRRWRTYPEYQDLDVFVERIPFRETREYVKVVQKNAFIYESLYGCGQGDPCLGAAPAPLESRPERPSEGSGYPR